jgi:dipeptidase E
MTMRLYLSSFKLGNQPQRLMSLAGAGQRAALVLNALDNLPLARADWLETQAGALHQLGLDVEELDLRDHFGVRNDLRHVFENIDVLWINGGNAFLLRRAMRQSGFDSLIHEFLQADRFVYAGFSAAVCCAAPTLRGAEFVDDPNGVAEEYDPDVVWDGLGLINYNVAVHYKSSHPESEAIEKEIRYYEAHRMPYKTLMDGQVLIVNARSEEIVG